MAVRSSRASEVESGSSFEPINSAKDGMAFVWSLKYVGRRRVSGALGDSVAKVALLGIRQAWVEEIKYRIVFRNGCAFKHLNCEAFAAIVICCDDFVGRGSEGRCYQLIFKTRIKVLELAEG